MRGEVKEGVWKSAAHGVKLGEELICFF